MTAIDWPGYLLVLVCALVGAGLAVSLFAVGVRLLAVPAPGATLDDAETGPDDPGEDDPTTPIATRPRAATTGAVVVFVLAGAVALTGVVLIVH